MKKKQNQTDGRSYAGRGISMPAELWQRIDRHVADSYPAYANTSHFLQVLAHAAMEQSAKAGSDETKSSPKRQG